MQRKSNRKQRQPDARPALALRGRYQLDALIGRGPRSEVYRARLRGRSEGRGAFVIKKLSSTAHSQEEVRTFLDEGRLVRWLDHPSLVRVHSHFTEDGALFVAMEHLDGQTLAEVLERLRGEGLTLPVALAAYIIVEVARALEYLHALCDEQGQPLGIVHQDISPSNIMLLRSGGVKLMECGGTYVSRNGTDDNRRGGDGKAGYAAPEQVRHGDVDRRTDLFALGIVFWECLSGRRLWTDTSSAARLANVLYGHIPPPSVFNAAVPQVLDDVVLEALERSRRRRFADAAELIRQLEPFCQRTMQIRRELADIVAAEEKPNPATTTVVSSAPADLEATVVERPRAPVPAAFDLPRGSVTHATVSLRRRPERDALGVQTWFGRTRHVFAELGSAVRPRRSLPVVGLLSVIALVVLAYVAGRAATARDQGPAVAVASAAPPPTSRQEPPAPPSLVGPPARPPDEPAPPPYVEDGKAVAKKHPTKPRATRLGRAPERANASLDEPVDPFRLRR